MDGGAIDTTEELLAALKQAKGGETLTLAPGEYANVSIKDIHKAPAVVITGKGAVFPGLKVNRSSGLVFRKLEFYVSQPGQFAYLVNASKGLVFEDLHVHGTMNGTPHDDASGISIRNSSDIKILRSRFEQLKRGVGLGASQNIVVADNRFSDLQVDGITASQMDGVQVLRNAFTDFHPQEGNHPDAVQFLTGGKSTSGNKNLLISDNVVTRGKGGSIQGIFLRDETEKFPFDGVKITNNLLIGSGYHGIGVAGASNVEISGNELLSYEGKENQNWIMVRRSDAVTVRDNRAVRYNYDKVTNLAETGNKKNKPVRDGGAAALAARARPAS